VAGPVMTGEGRIAKKEGRGRSFTDKGSYGKNSATGQKGEQQFRSRMKGKDPYGKRKKHDIPVS